MQEENEKPPLFKSWASWYQLLMGALAIQIIVYYLLSQRFA
jgi:hypothetical protein